MLQYRALRSGFNLNLNDLLVKRENDNPSPGDVTGGGGGLVRSSHKRSELDTPLSDTSA